MKPDELHFLVVEDDDFQRETLADMLLSMGAKSVRQAGDGKQALEILQAQSAPAVDIVLSDLEMPEMDGMEYFRHMGSHYADISLIIMSALDSALIASVEEMARAYGIRLLGAIEKPVTRSRLQTLIAQHEAVWPKQERVAPSGPASFTLEDILDGLRKNQFEPFYQPKVNIASGQIKGVEALARWIHPEHGVIGPYAFIAVLERNGKLDDLTFTILKKAASACRQLHESGHKLSMAVNISLTSLTDTALANRITQVMHEAAVDPRYFILEVTETAAMTDVAHALENLARLRMRGFGLSIDDYGTGYSSMQQISRIAFSELKIDQTFVRSFSDNESLRIIVQSSIDLAHKLRIKCTAEGVETERDWSALKAMRCDLAQGYFIAKPMNLESLLEFCGSFGIS
ncbi:EAL domain-containing response regulator [Methylomicrobium sp. RS1]|uniref:EAL domain-containing response regulator n=1 Tax=Candidatus Methylomicrobium oryzae TaxID=2802053 RepID=UPI001924645D|nr:EAL domain-containing response regulator [Methylomicrobium sp. RS1]